MPQIQVFQCPSCGANLSYDGGPETTLTCQFCGSSVIVPAELRSGTAGPGKPSGAELPVTVEAGIKKILSDVETLGRDNVDDPEILELLQMEVAEQIDKDIQTAGAARSAQLTELLRLVASGQKPQAENLFRQAFPSMSASEANLAVDILARGPLD